MNHLWIAYDALIVTIGVVNLALLFLAHPRKRFLSAFSLFYGLFTAGLMVALSRSYIAFNVEAPLTLPVFLSYGLNTLLSWAAFSFVVLFYHRLLDSPQLLQGRAAMLGLGIASLLAISPLGVRYGPETASYLLRPGYYVAAAGYFVVFSYAVYLAVVAAISVDDRQDRAFCRGLLAFALIGYVESGVELIMNWRNPTGALNAEAERFLYSSIPYLLFSLFLTVYLLRLLQTPLPGKALSADQLADIGLSAREQEVLHLVLKGLNNKRIADELHISVATVKTHLNKIFKKANVSSRFELARLLQS